VNTLREYACALVSATGKQFKSGEIFAKILTPNDDSGRHGVLVPGDAYSFFPKFDISDPLMNATVEFEAFDYLAKKQLTLAYKYYERYPERRITRLNGLINDRDRGPRMVIFLHARHTDQTSNFYVDCANAAPDGQFFNLLQGVFGNEISPEPGVFVMRPVDSDAFSTDIVLRELLSEFDAVHSQGWIDSLREGDTGIGYTFESMLGIKENNDRRADFKGIEIKCKSVKEGTTIASGKINLFQQGPVWRQKEPAKERIRKIGRKGDDGYFNCYSQLTTKSNNLGLFLGVLESEGKIDLLKHAESLGHWTFDMLSRRLAEKHARAVLVKASTRVAASKKQFRYDELVYCEKPSIERFVHLVGNCDIVFEFLMSEKPDGSVRNHGYPWRLVREEYLDQLYTFQIKLR
jgi:MvaI/BcnI restriction endonuclease family